MDFTIEPKKKDFEFYSKFYLKKLQDEESNILRWKRFTEKRLEELGNDTEIYEKQIERMESYDERLELYKEMKESPMDETNEKFLAYVVEQLTLKEKQVVNSKKKKEAGEVKKQRQDDCMKKFRSSESRHNREDRFSEKNMNYFYDKMMKIDSEMPKYLREQLDNMPANKGYIYKGIWYFGHVPLYRKEDEKYLTMFERVKGIQYIHEYIHEYPMKTYKLWEKLSKTSPKKLIHSEQGKMR